MRGEVERQASMLSLVQPRCSLAKSGEPREAAFPDHPRSGRRRAARQPERWGRMREGRRLQTAKRVPEPQMRGSRCNVHANEHGAKEASPQAQGERPAGSRAIAATQPTEGFACLAGLTRVCVFRVWPSSLATRAGHFTLDYRSGSDCAARPGIRRSSGGQAVDQ
jgi:hypothetical protein